MSIRDDYLEAGEMTVELLGDPAVAERWQRPSALRGLGVAGLAVHLGAQIRQVAAAPPAVGAPIGVLENYVRSPWVGEDADHEVNVNSRVRFEQAADLTPNQLESQATGWLEEARKVLATAPEDHAVHLPWAGWDLRFDEFLLTKMLEMAVHSDDLAVSVGVPTPPLPDSALFAVTDLLSRLAARRHGGMALLRALSRSERAPASISAL